MSSSLTSVQKAIVDLQEGCAQWQLWTALGWMDVQRRFHRSVFGPLWNTLSLAIFVVTLGTLYANLMNRPAAQYIPHLTLGVLTWNLLINSMMESCNAFKIGSRFIKEIPAPLSLFVFRTVWRNAIVFCYQFLVFVGVAVFIGIPLKAPALLAIPGLLLVLLNAMWLGICFSIVSTRYRDVQEMLVSIMRILFFLTPILWIPDQSERFQALGNANPFYHFIEIVRAHLQGGYASGLSWLVVIGVTVIGWPISLALLGRYRKRVPYWL